MDPKKQCYNEISEYTTETKSDYDFNYNCHIVEFRKYYYNSVFLHFLFVLNYISRLHPAQMPQDDQLYRTMSRLRINWLLKF